MSVRKSIAWILVALMLLGVAPQAGASAGGVILSLARTEPAYSYGCLDFLEYLQRLDGEAAIPAAPSFVSFTLTDKGDETLARADISVPDGVAVTGKGFVWTSDGRAPSLLDYDGMERRDSGEFAAAIPPVGDKTAVCAYAVFSGFAIYSSILGNENISSGALSAMAYTGAASASGSAETLVFASGVPFGTPFAAPLSGILPVKAVFPLELGAAPLPGETVYMAVRAEVAGAASLALNGREAGVLHGSSGPEYTFIELAGRDFRAGRNEVSLVLPAGSPGWFCVDSIQLIIGGGPGEIGGSPARVESVSFLGYSFQDAGADTRRLVVDGAAGVFNGTASPVRLVHSVTVNSSAFFSSERFVRAAPGNSEVRYNTTNIIYDRLLPPDPGGTLTLAAAAVCDLPGGGEVIVSLKTASAAYSRLSGLGQYNLRFEYEKGYYGTGNGAVPLRVRAVAESVFGAPVERINLPASGLSPYGALDAFGNLIDKTAVPADDGNTVYSREVYFDIWGNGRYEFEVIGKTAEKFILEITNIDDEAPVIELFGGAAVTVLEGSPYADFGFGARDNRSDSAAISLSTDFGGMDASDPAPGVYSVVCTAADEAGNTASAARTVTVLARPLELTISVSQSQRTASLSGRIKYLGDSPVTERGFVWDTSDMPTVGSCLGSSVFRYDANNRDVFTSSIPLSSLVQGVAYTVRAFAVTAAGTVYSAPSRFTAGGSAFGSFGFDLSEVTVSPGGEAALTIRRSGGSDGAQTVTWRTAAGSAAGGVHFTANHGTVVFEAGETEKRVSIHIEANPVSQYWEIENRVFYVEITHVTGGASIDAAASRAAVTIGSNDRDSIELSGFGSWIVLSMNRPDPYVKYSGAAGGKSYERYYPSEDGVRLAQYGYWAEHGRLAGRQTIVVNRYEAAAGIHIEARREGGPWIELTGEFFSSGEGYRDIETGTFDLTGQDYIRVRATAQTQESWSFVEFKNPSLSVRLTDVKPPELVSLSARPGSYKTGDSVFFTARFDEIVRVTNQKELYVRLNGDDSLRAVYETGSGTDTVVFRLAVPENVKLDGVTAELVNIDKVADLARVKALAAAPANLPGVGLNAMPYDVAITNVAATARSVGVTVDVSARPGHRASGAEYLYAFTPGASLSEALSAAKPFVSGGTLTLGGLSGSFWLSVMVRDSTGLYRQLYGPYAISNGVPVVALSYSTEDWTSGPVRVWLTPADPDYLGPKMADLTLWDGASPLPLLVDGGRFYADTAVNKTFNFILRDSASGAEFAVNAPVGRIDKDKPSLSAGGTPERSNPGAVDYAAADPGMYAFASDLGSGIAPGGLRWQFSSSASPDPGGWRSFASGQYLSLGEYLGRVPGGGRYWLHLEAADRAGNVSSYVSQPFDVPVRTAPAVSVAAEPLPAGPGRLGAPEPAFSSAQLTAASPAALTTREVTLRVTASGGEGGADYITLPDGRAIYDNQTQSAAIYVNGRAVYDLDPAPGAMELTYTVNRSGFYRFTAVDAAGTPSDGGGVPVTAIDREAPVISYTVRDASGKAMLPGRWTAGGVTLELSFGDDVTPVYDGGGNLAGYAGSGGISYAVMRGGEPDKPYEAYAPGGKLTLSFSQNESVVVKVRDSLGNTDTRRIDITNIDTEPPTVTTTNPSAGVGLAPITMALKFYDSQSGLAGDAEYSVSGTAAPGPWERYDGGIISLTEPGNYYVHYKAADAAGNTAAGRFGPYTVSDGKPSVSIASPTADSFAAGLLVRRDDRAARSHEAFVTVTYPPGQTPDNTVQYQWAMGPVPSAIGWRTAGGAVSGQTLSVTVGSSEIAGADGRRTLHIRVAGGIAASRSFMFDNSLPQITITGANPFYAPRGEPYADWGATASDDDGGHVLLTTVAGGADTALVPTDTVGIRSVVYAASDEAGNSVTAVRRVIVYDAVPPVAEGFARSLAGNGSLAFTAGDFLSRYYDDGNVLVKTGGAYTQVNTLSGIVIETPPAHGRLNLGGAGIGAGSAVPLSMLDKLVYYPAPDYSGTDSFTFRARDTGVADRPGNLSAPATVTLTITRVSAPPKAGNHAVYINEGAAVTVDLSPYVAYSGNAPVLTTGDISVSPYPTTKVSVPGSASVSGLRVTYTPAGSFNGVVTIPYTVTDSAGASGGAVLTVFVANVNNAPVLAGGVSVGGGDNGLFRGGQTVTVSWPAAADADNDRLTYALVCAGSVIVSSHEGTSYSWTIPSSFNGAYSVSVTASDGVAASETISSAVFSVDSVKPVVHSLTPASAGWTNAPVDVTASVSDAATGRPNPLTVEYSVSASRDGITFDTWSAWSQSCRVSAEGVSRVRARVTDAAGNVGDTLESGPYLIDRTPPAAFTPVFSHDDVLSGRTGIGVAFSTRDDESARPSVSGLAAQPYFISVDGGAFQPCPGGSYHLGGLAPGSEHSFTLRAADAAGNFRDETVTLRARAQDAQTAFLESRRTTSLTVGFTAPANPAGTQYRVWLTQKGSSFSVSVSDWDSALTRTLDGLSPDTQYILHVSSRNGDGLENPGVSFALDGIGEVFRTNVTVKLTLDDKSTPQYLNSGSVTYTGSVSDPNEGAGTPSVTVEAAGVSVTPSLTQTPGQNRWTFSVTFDMSGNLSGKPDGMYFPTVTATDNRGDVIVDSYAPLYIDRQNPLTPVITVLDDEAAATNPNKYTSLKNVRVRLSGAGDNPGGGGVRELRYMLEGAQVTDGFITCSDGEVIVVSAEGITTLTLEAEDYTGNKSRAVKTLYLDHTKPIVSISSLDDGTWKNTGIVVVLDAWDDLKLGAIYLTSTTGPASPGPDPAGYTTSFDLSSENTATKKIGVTITSQMVNYVHMLVVDRAGNKSTVTMAPFRIDTTAPAPVMTIPSGEPSPSTPSRSHSAVVEVFDYGKAGQNASAGHVSGVQGTGYLWAPPSAAITKDTPGWQTFESGATISAVTPSGQQCLWVRCSDVAGNVSVTNLGTFNFDASPPNLPATPDVRNPGSGGSLEILLSCNDSNVANCNSGLDRYKYAFSSSPAAPSPEGLTWRTADTSGVITVGQTALQGDVYLHIWIIDKAGNQAFRTYGPYSYHSDAAPPDVSAAVISSGGDGEVVIVISDISGIDFAASSYTVNSGPSRQFSVPDGSDARIGEARESLPGLFSGASFTIEVSAADKMGNTLVKTLTVDQAAFAADSDGPGISFAYNTDRDKTLKYHSVAVSIADTGSGVRPHSSSYGWSLSPDPSDVSAWSALENGGAVILDGITGGRYLHVRSYDIAGNVSYGTTQLLNFDNTPPSVSASRPDSSYHMAVGLTVTAADVGSGVSAVYWAEGVREASYFAAGTATAGVYAVTAGTFSISKNNVYTICAVDGAGNMAVTSYTESKIDKVAPDVSLKASTLARTKDPITVAVTASDAGGSGIASTTYRIDGGDVFNIPPDGVITITGDGSHTLSVTVTDGAGNSKTAAGGPYIIDNTVPVITITAADAVRRSHSIPVTATGVIASIRYGWAGESASAPLFWMEAIFTGNDCVVVRSEGTGRFRLFVEATTDTGIKSTASQVFEFDNTPPPIMSVSLSETGWTRETSIIVVAEQGAAVSIYLGGAQVSNPITANGLYTVIVTDTAGNETIVQIQVSNVDRDPPAAVLRPAPDAWYNRPFTVTVDAFDALSGLERVSFDTNPVLLTSGIYTLSATVTDKAGNTAVVTGTYYIDLEKPTLNPVVTGISETGMTILPNAADTGGSGVASVTGANPSGLTPNTRYVHTVIVADGAGNSASAGTDPAYTLAALPAGLSDVKTSPTSLGVTLVPGVNGTAPRYAWRVLTAGSQVLAASASASRSPVIEAAWAAPVGINDVLTLEITAYNEDNLPNTTIFLIGGGNYADEINAPPSVTVDSNDFSISGNSSLVFSGTYYDPNVADTVTITILIDEKLYSATGSGGLWSVIVPASALREDIYTNLTVTADDGRGGVGTALFTGIIRIDKTAPKPPVVTITSGDGWRRTGRFSASPGGGDADIGYYEYAVNGGGWASFDGSEVALPAMSGEFRLAVRAVDTAGNTGFVTERALFLDGFEPEADATQPAAGWVSAPVSVTVDISDEYHLTEIGYIANTLSNMTIASLRASLTPVASADGRTASETFTLYESGVWYVHVLAGDNAGAAVLTFGPYYIDVTPPDIGGLSILDVTDSSITARSSASDAHSGLASLAYTIDGGAPQSGGLFAGLDANREYVIRAEAEDNAGLTSGTSEIAVRTRAADVLSVGLIARGADFIGFNVTPSPQNHDLAQHRIILSAADGTVIARSAWTAAAEVRVAVPPEFLGEMYAGVVTRNSSGLENDPVSLAHLGALTLTSAPAITLAPGGDLLVRDGGVITISGTVYDADGGPLYVRAVIDGVEKTAEVSDAGAFSLTWDVSLDALCKNTHGAFPAVEVTVTDGEGNTVPAARPGVIYIDNIGPAAPRPVSPVAAVIRGGPVVFEPGVDYGAAGVAGFFWELTETGSGSVTTGNTLSVEIPADGDYSLTAYFTDTLGNIGQSAAFSFRSDSAPPALLSAEHYRYDPVDPAGWLPSAQTPGPGAWFTSDIRIAFVFDEGFASCVVSADGNRPAAFPAGTSPAAQAVLCGEGTFWAHVLAVDDAGNENYLKYGPYNLDQTPPELDATALRPGLARQSHDARVTLFTPPGELASLEYVWSLSPVFDPAESRTPLDPYGGPSFTLTLGGVTGLYYLYAVASDAAGNVSVARSAGVTLDNEPPVITLSDLRLEPRGLVEGVDVFDAHGSVVSRKYATGVLTAADFAALPENIFSGETLLTENETYTFYARDAAGNEAVVTKTVANLDFDPPSITADIASSGWINGTLTVTVTFDDANLKNIGYIDPSLYGGANAPYKELYDVSVLQRGYAIDGALFTVAGAGVLGPGNTLTVTIGGQGGDLWTETGGRLTLHFAAEDYSGHVTAVSFGPYLLDREAPDVSLAPGLSAAAANLLDPGSPAQPGVAGVIISDGVTADFVYYAPGTPKPAGVGSYTVTLSGHCDGFTVEAVYPGAVTYTVTDEAGNETVRTFDLSVRDIEPPRYGSGGKNAAGNAGTNYIAVKTGENTPYTFSQSDFLPSGGENALYERTLPLRHITVRALPSNGSLTFDGQPVAVPFTVPFGDIGKLVYAPHPYWSGRDTAMEFTACDGAGNETGDYSNSAYVIITVSPVAAPPVIDSSSLTDRAIFDTDSLTVFFRVFAPRAGSVSVTATAEYASCSVVRFGDGWLLTVTPVLNMASHGETVTVTASDENGSDSASFILTVNYKDKLFEARADSVQTDASGAAVIDALKNDVMHDPAARSLTGVAITRAPAHGTARVDASGPLPVVVYTADPGYRGQDSFEYSVTLSSALPGDVLSAEAFINETAPPAITLISGPGTVWAASETLVFGISSFMLDSVTLTDQSGAVAAYDGRNLPSITLSAVVTRNGVYTLTAMDAAGRTSSMTVTVTHVDADAPEVDMSAAYALPEGIGNVRIYDAGSGVDMASCPDVLPDYENSGRYIVPRHGFTVADMIGNSVTIVPGDIVPPEAAANRLSPDQDGSYYLPMWINFADYADDAGTPGTVASVSGAPLNVAPLPAHAGRIDFAYIVAPYVSGGANRTTYTVVITDAAGNATVRTVTMKHVPETYGFGYDDIPAIRDIIAEIREEIALATVPRDLDPDLVALFEKLLRDLENRIDEMLTTPFTPSLYINGVKTEYTLGSDGRLYPRPTAQQRAAIEAAAATGRVDINIGEFSNLAGLRMAWPGGWFLTHGKLTFTAGPLGGVALDASLMESQTLTGGDVTISLERGSVVFRLVRDETDYGWYSHQYPFLLMIPYTPKAGEDLSLITAVRYEADGSAVPVPRSWYADGYVYMIGYGPGRYSAAPRSAAAFPDVGGRWMEDAVDAMYARKTVAGLPGGTFAPGSEISRADFVTMLMQTVAATVDISQTRDFDDVNPSAYYSGAVKAARALGLVEGTGGNLFDPHAAITRQEMFFVTCRAMLLLGIVTVEDVRSGARTGFADDGLIEPYALAAAELLTRVGILSGRGGGLLEPRAAATRGEAAQLLWNVLMFESAGVR